MHVYSQKGYKYSKYWDSLHSHTGTVAQFTSLDQIDGGSRPENVKGVLHSFEHLFGSGCMGVSLCWQAVPSGDCTFFPKNPGFLRIFENFSENLKLFQIF
jgi:hypothetical protein